MIYNENDMQLRSDLTQSRVGQVLDAQEQAELEVADGILNFYLNRYPEVFVVICGECKTKLCLEYLDPNKLNPYHLHGRNIIELSSKYLSHRKRLDGAQGYQCQCGNDNRWAYVEWQATRSDGGNIAPHHEAMIADHITATNYVPDVKVKGRDTTIEGKFIVRRLK